jgi:hypothetical protein
MPTSSEASNVALDCPPIQPLVHNAPRGLAMVGAVLLASVSVSRRIEMWAYRSYGGAVRPPLQTLAVHTTTSRNMVGPL